MKDHAALRNPQWGRRIDGTKALLTERGAHLRYRPATRSHPSDAFVDGLQSFGFPPPCHPSYGGLADAAVGLRPLKTRAFWAHTIITTASERTSHSLTKDWPERKLGLAAGAREGRANSRGWWPAAQYQPLAGAARDPRGLDQPPTTRYRILGRGAPDPGAAQGAVSGWPTTGAAAPPATADDLGAALDAEPPPPSYRRYNLRWERQLRPEGTFTEAGHAVPVS